MNPVILNTTLVYVMMGVVATVVSWFVPAARSDQGCAGRRRTRAAAFRTSGSAGRAARRARPAAAPRRAPPPRARR